MEDLARIFSVGFVHDAKYWGPKPDLNLTRTFRHPLTSCRIHSSAEYGAVAKLKLDIPYTFSSCIEDPGNMMFRRLPNLDLPGSSFRMTIALPATLGLAYEYISAAVAVSWPPTMLLQIELKRWLQKSKGWIPRHSRGHMLDRLR
jgi:hypothetical protein